MTVGSPALAAYSLALTSLNTRLVYRRARRTAHRSSYAVAEALVSLQQIPLELTRDERLLVFVSVAGQWRRETVDRLNSRNIWSVSTGLFVGLIAIAFIFATYDSIFPRYQTISPYDPEPRDIDDFDQSLDGHAIGSLWLWSLCLVIGWFRTPAYTYRELGSAIRDTNQKAAKRMRAADAYHPPQRVVAPKSKRWAADPVPEVREENEKAEVESVQEDTRSARHEAESQVDPVPGPARHRLLVARNLRAKSHSAHANPGVTAIQDANPSVVDVDRPAEAQSITRDPINPERDDLLVRRRFDPLNPDEGRPVATFNYSRIMRYLILVDDVFGALDGLTRKRDQVGLSSKKCLMLEVDLPASHQMPGHEVTAQPRGTFPQGALTSMFIASVFALILQCGTTAAATIIVASTPKSGVWCRSVGYMIYGGIAVVIMFLTIISTISARISGTRAERSTTVKDFTAFVAIALRRISFLLALANATWLILCSVLPASGLFNTCYCNVTPISHGADSFILVVSLFPPRTIKIFRIIATVLAVACTTSYMIFLWIMSASPKETEYL